jgi:hypothetical protein
MITRIDYVFSSANRIKIFLGGGARVRDPWPLPKTDFFKRKHEHE